MTMPGIAVLGEDVARVLVEIFAAYGRAAALFLAKVDAQRLGLHQAAPLPSPLRVSLGAPQRRASRPGEVLPSGLRKSAPIFLAASDCTESRYRHIRGPCPTSPEFPLREGQGSPRLSRDSQEASARPAKLF